MQSTRWTPNNRAAQCSNSNHLHCSSISCPRWAARSHKSETSPLIAACSFLLSVPIVRFRSGIDIALWDMALTVPPTDPRIQPVYIPETAWRVKQSGLGLFLLLPYLRLSRGPRSLCRLQLAGRRTLHGRLVESDAAIRTGADPSRLVWRPVLVPRTDALARTTRGRQDASHDWKVKGRYDRQGPESLRASCGITSLVFRL